MLTHRVIKRVDLPHEPGQWIEVRMPSLNILDRARQTRSRRAIELMADVDLSHFRGISSDTDTPANGPDTTYDHVALVQACVTEWSYDEPVTPANVAELDEASVEAVIAVLLPIETAGDRKKD